MCWSSQRFVTSEPLWNSISDNWLCPHQVVHRTFAALVASFMSIGTLAALNDRPTMEDIVRWIDSETLLLIFSMMILVAVLTETGIFDYIAVYTFKVRKSTLARSFCQTIACFRSRRGESFRWLFLYVRSLRSFRHSWTTWRPFCWWRQWRSNCASVWSWIQRPCCRPSYSMRTSLVWPHWLVIHRILWSPPITTSPSKESPS